MNSVFSVTIWTWIVLVTVVLLLALYRLMIIRSDYYTVLHVRSSELSLIPEQIKHDRRLRGVDLWGQLLTVVSLIIGLALAAVYLYKAMG
jgi:hypothetical protein